MLVFDLVRVVGVRHVRAHVLSLAFSDGLTGELDLGPLLRGEAFRPLLDEKRFAEVVLEGGSIAWPNGADWAPETLHDLLLAANGHESKPNDHGDLPTAGDLRGMPEISRFFGIVIRMFYQDHVRPHFRAQFGERSIAVEIEGDGVTGSFRPHRLHLLFEWRDLHRAELLDNWNRLRRGDAPLAIPGLE
jgi:hypothetical protein